MVHLSGCFFKLTATNRAKLIQNPSITARIKYCRTEQDSVASWQSSQFHIYAKNEKFLSCLNNLAT